MNKNIEFIIPGKLAAVKFSYIPFIGEIEYKPIDEIPAYTEAGRVTDGGMILLNKDRPGYKMLKQIFMCVVPLSHRQLSKRHSKLASKQQRSLLDDLNLLCVEMEQERRKKIKEVEKNGNN